MEVSDRRKSTDCLKEFIGKENNGCGLGGRDGDRRIYPLSLNPQLLGYILDTCASAKVVVWATEAVFQKIFSSHTKNLAEKKVSTRCA